MEDRSENPEFTEPYVETLIRRDFPAIEIDRIQRLGEGMGNVAFDVNGSLVFRFPKTRAHQRELEREIPLLELIAKHSPLPIPRPEFVAQSRAYIGYRTVPGTPLIEWSSRYRVGPDFAAEIGRFLCAIHSIPLVELQHLQARSETEPWDELLRDARKDLDHAREIIPRRYWATIDSFFESTPPSSSFESVFCHNDLGIEHILVLDNRVSGVIDWGDCAITDPARDFGLLYRDLGPNVLQQSLDAYSSRMHAIKDQLLERAVFYGKCRVFENIAYGLEENRREYQDTGLTSLQWMFGGQQGGS